MPTGRRGEQAGVVDLRRLDLAPGAGAAVEVPVHLDVVHLGGQAYASDPPEVEARLDVGSSGSGLGLRLRFGTTLRGPCQRCLADSALDMVLDVRDFQATGRTGVDAPDDDLDCEYLSGSARMELDLAAWARDSVAEALPMAILCRDDCAGLCAQCGTDLNTASCTCVTDDVDPRWAALGELRERLGDDGDDTT
jgi:uncharacterized protein